MNKYHHYLSATAFVVCTFTAATAFADQATIPNTFTSGTAAVAADVNDNFTALKTAIDDNDSRITAREASVISLPPSIFVSAKGVNCKYHINSSQNFGYIESGGSGGCQLVAPIMLPHGRTITELTCYLKDNNALYDFDAAFTQHDMLTTDASVSVTPLASFSTNGTQQSTVVTRSPNSIPDDLVVDNASYHYQLRLGMDNAFTGGDSLSVHGCSITYE